MSTFTERTSRWRAVPGWVLRVLIGVVAVVVALATMGAGYEAIASTQDSQQHPAPGQLFDVGGYRLHISCSGQGSPTVVLEAGGGGASLDWSLVQPAAAEGTEVCAYDRAGAGWSEAGPLPRTPQRVADDLHTLLQQAKLPGPYVLVTHSDAGIPSELFMVQHPDEVAGVVLVDARQPDSLSAENRQHQLDQARMLPTITTIVGRFGIGRLFGADLYPQIHPEGRFLPSATRKEMLLQSASPVYVDQVISTIESATANDLELQALTPGALGSKPLVVLTSEQYLALYSGWRIAQQELSALSRDSVHVTVASGEHYLQWQHPQLVTDAISQVVDAVRSGVPLRSSI